MPANSLICGAPGMTRTCDLLVRSQTLYPTELRARIFNNLQPIQTLFEQSGLGRREPAADSRSMRAPWLRPRSLAYHIRRTDLRSHIF
jgi:hypothetical protein